MERFGPGSVAVLASGEQTIEQAHAWARVLDEALGGGVSVSGAEGGPWWAQLEPHAAAIEDLAGAATIVVAGDADLAHRAPVLELWIRKGVRNGARVVTVGPGATRLGTLRGAVHISAAPGTSHTVLLEAAAGEGELAGHLGEPDTIVIWAGAMRAEVASVLAHVAHSAGCTVLRTPRTANEIGCTAAGLGTVTPDQALEQAEAGKIRAMVLLGADPVGDWHSGERWRAALARCFFALQVTDFQNDSTGWVTTSCPPPPRSRRTARDQPRGPRAARPGRRRHPAGRPDGSPGLPSSATGWASACPTTRRAPSPIWPLADRPSAACRGRRSASARHWERARRLPPRRRCPSSVRSPTCPRPSWSAIASSCRARRSTTPRSSSSSAGREIEIAHADAERLAVATGDRIEVMVDGRTHTGPALVQRALRPGVVRLPTRIPHVGPGSVRVAPAEAAADA